MITDSHLLFASWCAAYYPIVEVLSAGAEAAAAAEAAFAWFQFRTQPAGSHGGAPYEKGVHLANLSAGYGAADIR